MVACSHLEVIWSHELFNFPDVRERCCFVEILPQQSGINVLMLSLKRKDLACYWEHKNSRFTVDAACIVEHSHSIKSAPLFKCMNTGMCKSTCQSLDEAVSLFHFHNIP